ncbi:MAG: hypothetical protein KDA21_03945 [Phycisphaerales bacterium]|nr:hypothetical protein [Phycisphaerales bacterium]
MMRCVLSCVAALSCAGPVLATTYGPAPGGNIPDNDAVGFLSPIVVEQSFAITSVSVTITGLDHGYSSDLTIELRHQGVSSPTSLLINLNFGEDADFNGTYTFADTGANLWTVAGPLCCLEDIPSGTYRASGPGGAIVNLNAKYAGENAQGVWLLRVVDDDFLVAGGFMDWTLELGGGPACTHIDGDVDGNLRVDFDDLNLLLGNWGTECE